MNETIIGADGVLDKIAQAQEGASKGAVKGLGLGLHLILQVSNSRVPHEEGDLERDGAVVVDEDELTGAVTYGRDPKVAAYAERQHEDLSLRHDPGREAKFLENARNNTSDQVQAILMEQIRQGMGL